MAVYPKIYKIHLRKLKRLVLANVIYKRASTLILKDYYAVRLLCIYCFITIFVCNGNNIYIK